MYQVFARIRGTAPILQHKFGSATLEALMQGSNKKTAAQDYSMEWQQTMYASVDGFIYQPAAHIEGCLVKAGALFQIKGRRGKTYKDTMRAYVYAQPDEIPILWNNECIPVPDEALLLEPTEALSVSVMRVVVQRAAVARARLQVATGWEMALNLEVHDEQLRPEVVEEILREGGRAIGIGDFRPRYGRFEVVQFQQVA